MKVRIECLPGDLCPSFGFLSQLVEIRDAGSLGEHFGVWRLEAMKGSLGMSPFEFSSFLAEIFLPGEGNLCPAAEFE